MRECSLNRPELVSGQPNAKWKVGSEKWEVDLPLFAQSFACCARSPTSFPASWRRSIGRPKRAGGSPKSGPILVHLGPSGCSMEARCLMASWAELSSFLVFLSGQRESLAKAKGKKFQRQTRANCRPSSRPPARDWRSFMLVGGCCCCWPLLQLDTVHNELCSCITQQLRVARRAALSSEKCTRGKLHERVIEYEPADCCSTWTINTIRQPSVRRNELSLLLAAF